MDSMKEMLKSRKSGKMGTACQVLMGNHKGDKNMAANKLMRASKHKAGGLCKGGMAEGGDMKKDEESHRGGGRTQRKSIGGLMSQAGDAIQKYGPTFMGSPLSGLDYARKRMGYKKGGKAEGGHSVAAPKKMELQKCKYAEGGETEPTPSSGAPDIGTQKDPTYKKGGRAYNKKATGGHMGMKDGKATKGVYKVSKCLLFN